MLHFFLFKILDSFYTLNRLKDRIRIDPLKRISYCNVSYQFGISDMLISRSDNFYCSIEYKTK